MNNMKIEFSTGNAAFDEECGGSLKYETIRILREICEKIEMGCTEGSIIDINGNKIGEWGTMKSLQERLLESVQNYYERMIITKSKN